MSSSHSVLNARGNARKDPAPDLSKTYNDVPCRHIPPKSYCGSLLSKLAVECGLPMMTPRERIVAVIMYIVILIALFTVPVYLLYILYHVSMS
ncbi:hypothetical protein TcYC6_0118200 [Trypanosoma cruzi]|nr:hypothetical protein TcYC6_0118200 [Trypanosoma cruzi]